MAAFVKVNAFPEHLAHKVHNLSADALKIYLSNGTLDAAADAVKADLAEIATVAGHPAGGLPVTVTSSAQTGGNYKLVGNDVVFTVSGGAAIGPFRTAVLYNDTPTNPADPIIGGWDYGQSVTLANDGETFTVDLSQANGFVTINQA